MTLVQSLFSQLYGRAILWIATANLAIFFGLEARLERLLGDWNTFAVDSVLLHPVIKGSHGFT